jgi:hypothetical protein
VILCVWQNVHQAGFLATRKQLQQALASGCLHGKYEYHWSYHSIEAADTELYFRCGFMKVIPLSPRVGADGTVTASLKPFALHHLPNKYVKEGVTLVDKFHLTADALLQWLSICHARGEE